MFRRIGAVLAVIVALSTISTAQAQTTRPQLENEETFGTDHFLIHYTLVGEDAVNAADENQNGTPDYVEAVAAALEAAYATQITAWGWTPPPADSEIGGDDRLDVYLVQLFNIGIAGLVSPDDGWIGDNPATAVIERNAAYSYMALDNDFAEISEFEPDYDIETTERFIEAVIAHEFNHMVQSGYNGFDDGIWLYEATATWTEWQTFGTAEFAGEYLPYVLKNPDYCLSSSRGRSTGGLRWYGQWLFMEHLTVDHGEDIVQDIWDAMRRSSSDEALDEVLAAYGSSLEREAFTFGVKNLVRAYANGEDIPTVRLEGATRVGRFRPVDGVEELAVDYVRVEEVSGMTTISLFEQEADLSIAVVTVEEDGSVNVIPGGESVTVDIDETEPTYIMVFNATRWAAPDQCQAADYRINIQSTDDEPTLGVELGLPINYAEPIIGDTAGEPTGILRIDRPFVSDPEGQFGERPESIQVSFAPVVPEGVDDYAFDFAAVRQAEDFGFLEPYYVPGGAEAAVYDYTNADDDYLRVTQSLSPYDTLEDWLDAEDYDTEGDFREVGGSQVLLEDLSRDGQTWISATFIVDGLFVVIDGSGGEDVVLAMVESYLREAGALVVTATQQPNLAPTVPPPPAFDDFAPLEPMDDSFRNELTWAFISVCAAALLLAAVALGTVLVIVRRVIPSPPR